METLHNTYDAMERLLTISILRYGLDMYNTSLPTHIRNHGMIDNLTMTYDGNRLKKVTDQCEELSYAGAMDFKDGADKAEEYTYDANGNMTRDLNKGISNITCNLLNLPGEIQLLQNLKFTHVQLKTRFEQSIKYLWGHTLVIITTKLYVLNHLCFRHFVHIIY